MKKNASCYLSSEESKNTLLCWLKNEGLISKVDVSGCGEGYYFSFYGLTREEFLRIDAYLESNESIF